MPVYLSIGKDKDGNFQTITSQKSGRTKLFCPFCGVGLIAKRGRKLEHHFAHDGETCKESMTALPSIAGWHHFHLNYPLDIVDKLKQGYDPHSASPNVYNSYKGYLGKYQRELLKLNDWTNNHEFTDVARVMLGSLPLVSFDSWMRETQQELVYQLKTDVLKGCKHKAWLEIEYNRQETLFKSALYLFEYKLKDRRVIHKIGITARTTNERLQETLTDLKLAGFDVAKAQVIREVAKVGYIERYAHHRYQEYLLPLANHREYFELDTNAVKKLKADFTKLTNQKIKEQAVDEKDKVPTLRDFEKDERFIATGRWRYEDKRIEASRKGVAKLKEQGKTVGRPKNITLSHEQLIAKHEDIRIRLERGYMTMETIAESCNKGLSTVKRVKAAIKALAREK